MGMRRDPLHSDSPMVMVNMEAIERLEENQRRFEGKLDNHVSEGHILTSRMAVVEAKQKDIDSFNIAYKMGQTDAKLAGLYKIVGVGGAAAAIVIAAFFLKLAEVF